MGLLKGAALLEEDWFSFSGPAEIFTFAAIHHWNWMKFYLTKYRTFKPCTRNRKKIKKDGNSRLLVKFYLGELFVSRGWDTYMSLIPFLQKYCLLPKYLVLGSFLRASLFTPNKFPPLGQTANDSPVPAVSSVSVPPIWKKGQER